RGGGAGADPAAAGTPAELVHDAAAAAGGDDRLLGDAGDREPAFGEVSAAASLGVFPHAESSPKSSRDSSGSLNPCPPCLSVPERPSSGDRGTAETGVLRV